MSANQFAYQVGDLINFQVDDPVFDTKDDAITHALDQSINFEENYFGVWDMHNNAHLIAIAHQGLIYDA